MSKCVECALFSLRQNADMARHGYGNCQRLKPWEYRSAVKDHECGWFQVAKKEDVEKRLEWLEKKKGGSNGNEAGSS